MSAAHAGDGDGRHRRRAQNRAAVLDALLALWHEGRYQPSAAQIAQRAGLSPRSLFRYFDDVDDLSRAAIERQLADARPLFDIDVPADAPTAEKILAVVAARARLFDVIAPGARAGRVCAHRQRIVAEQLHESRALLRNQVRRQFEPELRDRPGVLPAVDILLSFEARDLLRVDQRLPEAASTVALTAALTALLTNEG